MFPAIYKTKEIWQQRKKIAKEEGEKKIFYKGFSTYEKSKKK